MAEDSDFCISPDLDGLVESGTEKVGPEEAFLSSVILDRNASSRVGREKERDFTCRVGEGGERGHV